MVRRVRWPDPGGDLFYFKLYRPARASKKIQSAFRKDPARREHANLSFLRARGLPAVVPVAWGCRRRFGIVAACFLVTRDEPGFENLRMLLPVAAEPRRWVVPLARLVRRMHDAGFFAHDLHLRNVMAARDDAMRPGSAEPRLVLLDFPSGRILHADDPRRRQAVVHDLATLDRDAISRFSRPDRLRFLRCYLGDRRPDRDLIAAIERKRRIQVAKHERKKARKANA
jgi:hypothetical protein